MQLAPGAAAAGVGLIARDTVGSTNVEALALARAGERGPLWVTARAQSAGRGRRGRTWVSERGNLYASLLLTDPAPPERAAQLAFVAALAVHDAIAATAPALASQLAFQWPNDVLLAGAKLVGILIEAEGTPLVVAIGIGVNCAHHPADAERAATDLAAAGAPVTVEALFAALSLAMLERLREWQTGFASIRAAWLARAAGRGGELRARLGTRELTGRFETVDDEGRLRLRLPDGRIETIASGEVFPIAPAATDVGA
ncbi:MAG TPA: biotin--[acetyl-CoA-carboxylase] ligase [Xanthobacteraceae bacterium]|nr:biotin--[acetyl-CoA-carboxylase] ligase [Xanthobacteraceae bacterium]